jgi:hypothetical protein
MKLIYRYMRKKLRSLLRINNQYFMKTITYTPQQYLEDIKDKYTGYQLIKKYYIGDE